MSIVIINTTCIFIAFMAAVVIGITQKDIPLWIRIALPMFTFPLVLAAIDLIIRNYF